MAKKKSLKAKLTRISRSKQKTDKPVYQRLIGIESKIEYHPFLEDWGNEYQSLLRRALNDRQKGISETEIEKSFQKKYNIQWAWADSLATNASSVFDQLTTAKQNQISLIETDLKVGFAKAAENLETLENGYKNPSQPNLRNFNKKLLGVKSKLERLERKKRQLLELKKTKRLHICWGSKKLFKAQYNLEENGYASHEEWLKDWRMKRGGNFYSVGKGSVNGNNPVTKIHHKAEKYGIEVIFKNPFATSVIGMVKYMAKYGLNSAYAAAMVISRRALGFSERIPRSYWPIIGICTSSPEDKEVQSWGQWGKICKLLSKLKISRHQMFESAKVLEALHDAVSRTKKGKFSPRQRRKVKSASKPVVFSNSQIYGESPMPQNC